MFAGVTRRTWYWGGDSCGECGGGRQVGRLGLLMILLLMLLLLLLLLMLLLLQ